MGSHQSNSIKRVPTILWKADKKYPSTRIDVYETLCLQQMLVHKGGKIKNWGGECRDVTPTNCSLKIYLKRALGGGGVGLEGS